MFDARIFIDNLDEAKKILAEEKAEFKGHYDTHNYIYASKDPSKTLINTFLRLRLITKNIWDEKGVIVVIKNTKVNKVGKESIIPLKKQFDTESEARAFIDANYLDQFAYAFDFDCIGWQYFIGEDGVDLEEIEGHPSIEFKSPTEEGLAKLLARFNISPDQPIKGPSVVAVKKLLNK